MISVLIVDDQALIRAAVRQLVSHEPDLEVIAEASNGAEGVELARRLHPDVILMDLRMPVMSGIEATRELCADPTLASTRVLILTTFEEDEYVVQALAAGASGFVGKGTHSVDLMRAIHIVHGGESLLSPRATRALIDRYLSPTLRAGVPEQLGALTERELEILVLVARGLSNDEIAAELFISPATAKTHVNRTMAKLTVHDRAQLVIIAYESGLLLPGGG